jgi:hypothetical protein
MDRPSRTALVAGGVLALVLGGLGAWWLARGPAEVPVMVGGDGALDACATAIAGGTPAEVRRGPHSAYAVVDTLAPGTLLSVCGGSSDPAWRAIVYRAPDQAALDCGVATPIATPTPYAGPCRSGWLRADALGPGAG